MKFWENDSLRKWLFEKRTFWDKVILRKYHLKIFLDCFIFSKGYFEKKYIFRKGHFAKMTLCGRMILFLLLWTLFQPVYNWNCTLLPFVLPPRSGIKSRLYHFPVETLPALEAYQNYHDTCWANFFRPQYNTNDVLCQGPPLVSLRHFLSLVVI